MINNMIGCIKVNDPWHCNICGIDNTDLYLLKIENIGVYLCRHCAENVKMVISYTIEKRIK